MSLQDAIAFVLVALAAGYLVYKVGFSGRRRTTRGPDVPLARLTKRKRPH